MKICVVMPMYNEEAVAQESLTAILPYIQTFSGQMTLVIVDDGSTDATQHIVNDIVTHERYSHCELISHITNRGYGAALRSGTKYAIEHEFDYVLFMDCDLTNHPKYLEKFYEEMRDGWDYIKATRYAKGGGVEGVSWRHRIISRVGNYIARVFCRLPLTDFTNGFRAVKVSIIRRMDLKEPGFAVIMEELYQAKRLKSSFCEIPYRLTARKSGQGATHFQYNLKTCLHYLKYVIKGSLPVF